MKKSGVKIFDTNTCVFATGGKEKDVPERRGRKISPAVLPRMLVQGRYLLSTTVVR